MAAGAATPSDNPYLSPGVAPIGKVYQEQIERGELCFGKETCSPSAFRQNSLPNVRPGFFPGKVQAHFGPSCPNRIAREST
jgi:hypothetical protein